MKRDRELSGSLMTVHARDSIAPVPRRKISVHLSQFRYRAHRHCDGADLQCAGEAGDLSTCPVVSEDWA